MLRAVMFDLDGTLLPMDQDQFIKIYFGALGKKMALRGLDARKLIQAVATGTEAMVRNDGTMTNEMRFWKVFDEEMQMDHRLLEEDFNDFYMNEFSLAKGACKLNPVSNEVIQLFKEKGYRILCATNPLFPEIATLQRIEWAGIDYQDFELITTFEKCSFCKPNPQYYTELLEKSKLSPNEVIMIGNDVQEDITSARSLGIETNLITDDLINRSQEEVKARFIGTMAEFKEFVKSNY